MKRFFFYLLTVWIALWFQAFVNYSFGGSRVSADIVLMGVLYFGLLRGPIVGQALGFVWGLLIDASSLGLLGLHVFLYASAGYAAGMLRRQLDGAQAVAQAIFTFAVSVCCAAGYLAVSHLFASVQGPAAWPLVIQPLVNAILAPVFFWLARRWSVGWRLFPAEA